MSCDEVRALFEDWVDGEIDEASRRALEAHAASCPQCARLLQFDRRLKDLVARKASAPEPPAYLAEKVRRAVSVRRESRSWVAVVAVALFLGFAMWTVRDRSRREGTLVRALVDDHAKFLARTDAAEVAATDDGEIRAWFRGRLPFEVRLPELEARPVGARVCRVLERTCALVFYEKEGCRLSLFVFDEGDLEDPLPRRARLGRVAISSWSGEGLRFALVSDLSHGEMERMRGETPPLGPPGRG